MGSSVYERLHGIYRVINCNCNTLSLYCRATIGFREVHNQFPVSNIVTVLPCISVVYPIDYLICLVKVGLNRKKRQKSLILASFDGYLAFENTAISKRFELERWDWSRITDNFLL